MAPVAGLLSPWACLEWFVETIHKNLHSVIAVEKGFKRMHIADDECVFSPFVTPALEAEVCKVEAVGYHKFGVDVGKRIVKHEVCTAHDFAFIGYSKETSATQFDVYQVGNPVLFRPVNVP